MQKELQRARASAGGCNAFLSGQPLGRPYRMYPRFAATPAQRAAFTPSPERKTIVCRIPADGQSPRGSGRWKAKRGVLGVLEEKAAAVAEAWEQRERWWPEDPPGAPGSGCPKRSSQTFPRGRMTAGSSPSAQRIQGA